MSTKKEENLIDALDIIFDERKKFIILGLTGRTGSGCTTIADLLSGTFDEFGPPRPTLSDPNTDSERKYKTAYSYLEKNWGAFSHIKLRDIITSFILEQDISKLLSTYSAVTKSIEPNTLPKTYTEQFEKLHQARLQSKLETETTEEALIKDEIYNLYFKQIPKFTESTRDILNELHPGSFNLLYQVIANNIRRSGEPYSEQFNPKNIFRLSQRANKLIKVLRKRSKSSGERVLICLDAIRNPFEASFFKDRYSSFYLISVTSDNNERKARLRNELDLSDGEIFQIDKKEHPEKISPEELFYSQNIQRCVEISDIHIYNPTDNKAFRELKTQLTKYLTLIMHPGLITPTRSERCMQAAYNARLNSGCISRQVGAVIADSDYSIKALGWNNVAHGQTACNLRDVRDLLKNEDNIAFSQYEKNDPNFRSLLTRIYPKEIQEKGCGKPLCFCFKDIQNSIDGEKNQVHTRALHAEENAFLQISKYGGQGIEGGVLFTTASPCELCAKKAYQLGIKRIYYIDPYPGISNDQILRVGYKQPELVLFSGAIGRAYQQLYEPILPYKEELAIQYSLKIPNVKSELRTKNTELEHRIANLEEQLAAQREALEKLRKI